MKNSDVIAAAQKVIEFAKQQGFTDADMELQDDSDDVYSDLDDVIANYTEGEILDLKVSIILTDIFRIELQLSDPEDEESDLEITYP